MLLWGFIFVTFFCFIWAVSCDDNNTIKLGFYIGGKSVGANIIMIYKYANITSGYIYKGIMNLTLHCSYPCTKSRIEVGKTNGKYSWKYKYCKIDF